MWFLFLMIYLGYNHNHNNIIHALVIIENATEISEMTLDKDAQWLNYINTVSEFQNNVLLNYPAPDRGTGRYPPPKGSEIIPHPEFPQLLTMETHVQVWVVIDSFVRMNIEEQSLTLNVEEVYTWTDLSLKQDEDLEYSLNSSYYQFELSERTIWTPNLYPRHVVEYGLIGGEEIIFENMVQVQPSGEDCYMRKLVTYTIPCTVNVQNFPFDEHNCTLILSQPPSLNYRLRLHPRVEEDLQAQTEYYSEHLASSSAEWRLESSSVSVHSIQRPGDPFTMDELHLGIRVRRCASFYAIVLVFPCVLLNILSLVIFTLAPKDVERENFALTLILTYFVLIIIVVDASPPSGPMVPLLGLYIILSTLIVMVTFMMSLALIEVHEHCRQKDRKMGRKTLKLINNRFCISLFTTKDTYKALVKCYQNAREQNNQSNQEEGQPLKTKAVVPSRYLCLSAASESLKWKVLVKFVNCLCFVCTLLAHIVTGIVIMVCMAN